MTERPSGQAAAYRSKVFPNQGITCAMPLQASMLTRVPLAFGGRLLPNDEMIVYGANS